MDNNPIKKQMIKLMIEEDIFKNIKKAMNCYGIEGTEDIINKTYKYMPGLREVMIEIYKEIIRR